MSDLIKRSDAIRALNREKSDWNCDYNVPIDNCIKRLNKVKSANRPQEWIPCSEKLPNYREVVLISTFWGVRMAERDSVKEDGTDDFWYLFLDDATARPMYVYAWMPLPEPWKGADDE